MIIALGAVALGLLSLPGLMRSVGRRLPPSSWARLVGAALLAGLVLFELAALLMVAPPALRAVGFSRFAADCEAILGVLSPGGLPLAVVAAALVIVIPAVAWRAITEVHRVTRQARVEPGIGEQRILAGGAVLIVLPEPHPLALSVPTGSGQVTVTQGLLDALDDDSFQLVVDHELAHLRFGHARYLALATVVERAACWWPFTRPSARTLRIALERWADEEAAGAQTEHRARLREALLAVALGPAPPNGLAAFSGVDGIVERVDALDRPPSRVSPAWWTVLLVPGATLGILAAVIVSVWGHQAYGAVGIAAHCIR